jgi:RimJ/RimL family protein N-acetyltransferase
MMLLTPRMRLIPATTELVRAEIADRPVFATLLDATIPVNWPPEMLADALPWFLQQLEADPGRVGWMGWYAVLSEDSPDAPILVASGGFLGPPQAGTVEVGYSVLPQFQGQGFATEMVAALVDWALAQPGVERVIAEVLPSNTPSVRLLRRIGFADAGAGKQPEHILLERARTTSNT